MRYIWETSGKHLVIILETSGSWETSGRHLRDMWETSGSHLGAIWKTSGRHLGAIWETSGRHLGAIWETSGRHLGAIWETAGLGRPRQALARKCAKFIVKTDINCHERPFRVDETRAEVTVCDACQQKLSVARRAGSHQEPTAPY